MLRRDMGDPEASQHRRVLDFDTVSSRTIIRDQLGRSITVQRNDKGLVTSITDPRGFTCRYAYNANDELTSVTDRVGNSRVFEYSTKHPHYLTRMRLIRASGDVTIDYDYTSTGKLDHIDAGGASIDMQYEEYSTGGGVQTVVDENTGGRTEVEYNSVGLVECQTDAAGVKTSYDYFGSENPDLNGVVKSQTTGGVKTEFTYDLEPYDTDYVGYDGMARQMVDYWLYQYSNEDLLNDYDQYNNLQPGYLTSQQVQPNTVKSPAVGADGNEIPEASNVVSIVYTDQNNKADGTGKIYGITDPENRHIGMSYGASVARNETGKIDSQNSVVENTYYDSGEFIGRIQSSTTSRRNAGGTTETVSTTSYLYFKTGDLITSGAPFSEFKDAVHAAATDAHFSLSTSWPGFDHAYFECAITTTTQASGDAASGSSTYTDALGNSVATRSSDGKWSVTLYDAEQRSVFSHDSSGVWSKSAYDSSGLLLSTENHPATGDNTVS